MRELLDSRALLGVRYGVELCRILAGDDIVQDLRVDLLEESMDPSLTLTMFARRCALLETGFTSLSVLIRKL